jgi:multimeric flavodoxin WrbA
LGADQFELIETKPRTTKTIIFDMLLNRRPRLERVPENIEAYDLVIFMGPIWLFHIPSPLRTCFKRVKPKIGKYAFVSVSGGSLGPNPKISSELVGRLGKKLVMNLDLNIAQLLTFNEKPTFDDTGTYSLKAHPGDLERLTGIVVDIFSKVNI